MGRYGFITKEEFEATLHYGYYEGYVESLGYVYWGSILKAASQPEYPLNGLYAIPRDTTFVNETVRVPMVIPEEDLINGAEVSTGTISKAIVRMNPDNTLSVTFFDGRTLAVDAVNSSVNVSIAEEFFDGQRMKVVTVKVKDATNGMEVEHKSTLKDALNYLGDGAGYAAYLGPLQYHMGKHMAEVSRFRPIVTQDSYTVAKATSRYRYGSIPGRVATPLAKGLKTGGAVAGGIAIGSTIIQYSQGEISGGRMLSDVAFGVIGFCGLPGMVISLIYFGIITPSIDRPILPNTKDWGDDSQPKDNTRVILHDPWIGDKRIPYKK